MAYRFVIAFLLLFISFKKGVSQRDLVGLVDNQLIVIDSLTAKVSTYKTLQNFSQGQNIADLSFNTLNQNYYSIKNSSNLPALVSISSDGEFKEVGQFTLNGNQIPTVEALAYNSINNTLYAGVSLNGGTANNDFYSESIVEVNTATGECTFITEINTSKADPDIDVMTFVDDILYFFDGAPPGANFLSIYSLSFSNPNDLGAISSPVELFNSTYLPIRDFTATRQNIYLTSDRELYKYRIGSNDMVLVGTTHSTGDFSGALINGLSKTPDCMLPKVNLGEDRNLCKGETLFLDAYNPNSTYLWQDNSVISTLEVDNGGIYWVDVENSCGVVRDSIIVKFINKPEVDLGEDRAVCSDTTIFLDVTVEEGEYAWQDGSGNAVFEVTKSGIYWVNIKNACGVFGDSVSISFIDKPKVDLGKDRFVCGSVPILLDAGVENGTYIWQDGSVNSTFEVIHSGKYWVEVVNQCGRAMDSIELVVPDYQNLVIPNIFTPNNDEINDLFVIDERLQGSSIKVFQRSGIEVFSSDHYYNNWNGKGLPSGVYFWLVEDTCGNKYKGWVHLVR